MSDRDIIGTLTNEPSITGQFEPDIIIKGTMEARFPANVYVNSPVLLDRTGGNYTFSLDLNAIIASLPPAGVSSVFGRSGAITAQSGDYTFAQIGSKPTTISGYGITDGVTLTGAEVLTNKNLASGTNTFPTFNQNTTGSAAKLTTARNIDGQAFDGTANITVIAPGTHAATGKTTPVDADELPLVDTAASNVLKKLTWANLKATLAAWLVSAGWIRERLTASRTYYVRTDGSDSNNGLANTSGGAFLTLQKAINTVAGLDINGQSCTIQVGAGTYTASANASAPFVGGVPVLTGDTTTPSNVVLNVAGFCIAAQNGAELSVQGFRVLSTGDGILAQNAGRLNVIGNMEYAACSGAHMHAKYAGLITVTANYSVTGGAAWHWWAETAGGSIQVIGRTITITGTPAFGGAWAGCTIVAQIVPVSNTYSGSATGARYVVQLNGVIYSSGATLPGNSAGTALTGGQYN